MNMHLKLLKCFCLSFWLKEISGIRKTILNQLTPRTYPMNCDLCVYRLLYNTDSTVRCNLNALHIFNYTTHLALIFAIILTFDRFYQMSDHLRRPFDLWLAGFLFDTHLNGFSVWADINLIQSCILLQVK